MRKTILVMQQELRTTFKRPSFLFFAFGIPFFVIIILGTVTVIQRRTSENSGVSSNTPSEFNLDTEGFVDYSNLIITIYEDLIPFLLPFNTEEQAKEALEADKISAYYLIPSDYIQSGVVEYVFPNDRSFRTNGQKWVIQRTLILNLLEGNIELSDQVWNPVWHYQTHGITQTLQSNKSPGGNCTRPGAACESMDLIRLIPSLMVAIFFIIFMSSSSMLFNSVGVEKENRTIELLMLSISPQQLFSGKILALGIAGLTQTMAWLSVIYISFNLGGTTLNLPKGFNFPVEIVIWSVLLFIGGYSLFASLMAGAGAMVPKMKEAGIASFLPMFPLFLGYAFGLLAPFVGNTGSAFLVYLSLFPFTSPVVMVMRLTDGVVPIWQILLSIALLFITASFSIYMVAAMFQAQNLLSGQSFSAKQYILALVGRA